MALLELVLKSKLIDNNQLDQWLARNEDRTDAMDKPKYVATALVNDGLLTQFQARQLLAGKSSGFIVEGKYKLLELIAVGGMGAVYLCEHIHMRRLVALKFLPKELTQSPEAVERFSREARAIAALDHPNIVRAFDLHRSDQYHYLIMEYVDGRNLADLVTQFGPFSVDRAVNYIVQAACGLQHAHDLGWVHRDIKPGNLLLDRRGVIKVLDLGLARLWNNAQDRLTTDFDNPNVLGTADYISPEQALASSEVDIRADIYSLGATLYYLLTGEQIFPAQTMAQKLLMHQTRPVPSVRALKPEVPEGLEHVLNKMLAKSPTQRHQSPAELVMALAPWTNTLVSPPAEEEMPRWCLAVSRAYPPETQRSISDFTLGSQTSRSTVNAMPPTARTGSHISLSGLMHPSASQVGMAPVTDSSDGHSSWRGRKIEPAQPTKPPTPLPEPTQTPMAKDWWWKVAAGVLAGIVVLLGAIVIYQANRSHTSPPIPKTPIREGRS
jgi:serine/threonine protein kinase